MAWCCDSLMSSKLSSFHLLSFNFNFNNFFGSISVWKYKSSVSLDNSSSSLPTFCYLLLLPSVVICIELLDYSLSTFMSSFGEHLYGFCGPYRLCSGTTAFPDVSKTMSKALHYLRCLPLTLLTAFCPCIDDFCSLDSASTLILIFSRIHKLFFGFYLFTTRLRHFFCTTTSVGQNMCFCDA